MKDDISTPTPDGRSPNEFESGKQGTAERDGAEAAIEELRSRGGIFVEAVRATRMPMALTDPNLPGNPIVFANEAFLKLSGYRMEEVLGQQPHFMNGAGTDLQDIARFEEAIRADQDDIIETVQYRKNGTRFVATVLVSGFKDDEGRTLNHFMSWLDVTRRVDAEREVRDLQHIESALRESEAELAAELSDATLLRDLGLKLVTEESLTAIYEEILSAALKITGADAGTVQIYDNATKSLVLLVTHGFPRKMTDHFHHVDAHSHTACGIALRTGERTFVDFDDDVADEACRMHVEAGYRSAQATPLLSRSGEPIGMLNTHWNESHHRLGDREVRYLDLLARQAADLIERKQAEESLRDSERHAQTLLAELQHRVRNTLAVVRSIARRTAENTASADDMLGHFQGRLDAFSRVQAALTRSPGSKISLATLIDDELIAHATRDGEHVSVKGPDVQLEPRIAERLSLAIHELATNAVKHGALTNGNGRVEVRWSSRQLNGSAELLLSWKETGVQLSDGEPQREGFGMELLRRSLPYDLQAETAVDFAPTGLQFELRIPLPGSE